MKATEINIDRLSVGPLQDSSTVSSQKIAWIEYDDGLLLKKNHLQVQTPSFITETYGVPRQGPYYPTDKTRAFYKLPFCHERAEFKDQLDYEQLRQFYNKMLELDKFFGSEERRLQLFGEKMAGKYEYQPLVRQPEVSDEELLSKAYRPPYMKVKLPLSYDGDIPSFRLVNKKLSGEKTVVDLMDFSDVVKHMRFLTKHRMILEFQKLYAMKTSSGKEKRKYGLTVKLLLVECTNREEERVNPFVLDFDD